MLRAVAISLCFLCSFSNANTLVKWADEHLYGSFRVGVQQVNAGSGDNAWITRDFLSRVGIKESIRLNQQLSLIGNLEYGVRNGRLNDLSQLFDHRVRKSSIGVKGSHWRFIAGQQNLLWHDFVRRSYFSSFNDTLRQATIRDEDLYQFYFSSKPVSFALGVQHDQKANQDKLKQIQSAVSVVFQTVNVAYAVIKDTEGAHTGFLHGARADRTFSKGHKVAAYIHYADDEFDAYRGSVSGNLRAEFNGLNVSGLQSCVDESRSSQGIYYKHVIYSHFIHTRFALDHCAQSGDVSSFKVEYVHRIEKRFRVWLAYERLKNDRQRAPLSPTGENFNAVELAIRYDFQ